MDKIDTYIGIDVYLKTWNVTIIIHSGYKKHSQKSFAKELFEHLKKHYPNGIYKIVYESGFSGFVKCTLFFIYEDSCYFFSSFCTFALSISLYFAGSFNTFIASCKSSSSFSCSIIPPLWK